MLELAIALAFCHFFFPQVFTLFFFCVSMHKLYYWTHGYPTQVAKAYKQLKSSQIKWNLMFEKKKKQSSFMFVFSNLIAISIWMSYSQKYVQESMKNRKTNDSTIISKFRECFNRYVELEGGNPFLSLNKKKNNCRITRNIQFEAKKKNKLFLFWCWAFE